MEKVINQFRRLYDDKGRNDVNFDVQETRLRESRDRLTQAIDRVVKTAQTLSDVIMSQDKKFH